MSYTTVDPKQFVFCNIETRACNVQSWETKDCKAEAATAAQSWETNVKDCKAETDTAVQSGRTHLKKELTSSKPFGELFFKREHDAGHADQSAGADHVRTMKKNMRSEGCDMKLIFRASPQLNKEIAATPPKSNPVIHPTLARKGKQS